MPLHAQIDRGFIDSESSASGTRMITPHHPFSDHRQHQHRCHQDE
jgi:hypothetical protein